MESIIMTFLTLSMAKMKVLLTYMKDCLLIKMNMSWQGMCKLSFQFQAFKNMGKKCVMLIINL
jgi:hypothetical protein